MRSGRCRDVLPALALSLALPLAAAPAGAQRAPLWDTPVDGVSVTLGDAAVKGKLSFVAGSELADEVNGFERGLIAALDTRTGEVLWDEEAETATGNDAGARGESSLGPLALSKRVVVAGGFRELDGPTNEGVVRAYDQQTGTLLWGKRIDDGDFTEVAAVGAIAFAATTVGTGVNTSILVRAYDLTSGAELWDDTYGPSPEKPLFRALAAAGRYVAVVGSQEGMVGRDLVVRVYDAKTGQFLFDDVDEEADGVDDAFAATIRGRRLFVGGTRPETMGGNRDDVALAYDMKQQRRLWAHPIAEEGDQVILATAAEGSSLYTLGLANTFDLVLRAYDARTGVPRWDEVLDVNLTFVTDDIAAQGKRVVIGCDGGVFAFDARTGASAWDATMPALGAAIGGKYVVVPGFGGAAGYLAR